MQSIDDLVGMTFSSVTVEQCHGGKVILFTVDSKERYKLYYDQESVEINSITGNLSDLEGTPITEVSETHMEDANPPGHVLPELDDNGTFKWTICNFATSKGKVQIVWLEVSDGLLKHIQIKLEPRKRNNLSKLANYLLTHNWEDEDSSRFDMSDFYSYEDEEVGYKKIGEFLIKGEQPVYDCNTVACSLGHGPAAGIPCEKSEKNWKVYAESNFIDSWDSPLYFWIFDGGWAKVDNTPQGAAKRILYFLEHGIPENYEEQMMGQTPVSYL